MTDSAPPEAEAHHQRLTYLANAAQMLRARLNELTEEERDMVDDWIEELRIGQTVEGADALDAILVALGAGD